MLKIFKSSEFCLVIILFMILVIVIGPIKHRLKKMASDEKNSKKPNKKKVE